MSKKRQKHQKRPQPPSQADQPRPSDPVNVADGIPDRSEHCRLWKYLLLAAIFAAWIAFLVYCQVTAAPQ